MTLWRTLALATSGLLLGVTPLAAQSLADVARQERERLKNSKPTVVITTEQIKSEPAGAPAAREIPPSITGGPAIPTKFQDVRDEKYWRKAFSDARDELKRAEDQIKVIELKVNDLNSQLLNRSDIYGREQKLLPEIAKAQVELDKARQEVDKSRRKIVDLENELRRSGGLPGWAR